MNKNFKIPCNLISHIKFFIKFLNFYLIFLILGLLVVPFVFKGLFKQYYIGYYQTKINLFLQSLSYDFSSETINSNWCKNTHDINNHIPHLSGIYIIKYDGTVICIPQNITSINSTEHNATVNINNESDLNIAQKTGKGISINFKTNILYLSYAVNNKSYFLRFVINIDDLSTSLNIINKVFYTTIPFILVFSLFIFFFSFKKIFNFIQNVAQQITTSFSPYSVEIQNEKIFLDDIENIDIILYKIHQSLEKQNLQLESQITEQNAILNSISEAVLAIDTKEAPLFYNTKFALLFGINKINNIDRIAEVIRNPQILQIFRKTLQEGVSSEDTTVVLEVNNDKHFFSISTSPLRNQQGKIYGCVGIFHDITVFKKAEQMKTDFVANVSHELRTPLTTIKGYIDTIAEDLNSNKAITKELVTPIIVNTNRLINIVNDLLSLSTVELTDEIFKDYINTSDITSKILYTLDSQIKSKSHKIEVIIEESQVFANPDQLEQVMFNLIDNACKYTSPNGIITIKWYADNNYIWLSVKDTGPGIAEEHQQRIFERFYRIDKGRSRSMGGTGLGLAIVKHIMLKHKGFVLVKSKLNEGSEFLCAFPKI